MAEHAEDASLFKQEMMMAQARAGSVKMESKDRMKETLAKSNWLIEW